MAGGRKPGPQCSHNHRVNIDDGTMCLAPSPIPGPLGTASGELTNGERDEYVSHAYGRAVQLAPAVLYREIGHAADQTLARLTPDLFRALKVLSARGAVAPARPIDGSRDILAPLGLEFLPKSIDSSLGEMTRFVQSGVSLARNAGEGRRADRDSEVEQAAQQLARAAGILLRAILQGIAAYLMNSGSTADETVAQLVRRLRSSKLDGSLAAWVEQNWKDLVAKARMRLRPERRAGLGGSPSVASSERMPRTQIPHKEPASDPPIFSSNTNLVAQAATLIAAAAQGAPFCPL